MSSARKETERTKFIQDKCQSLLTQMLRDEDNKYCVDCDAKGPRWASWNLGVFLCIRCAGIHRNLGVHISRVRSVNLDTWTPEQVVSLQNMGNSRARAVYEAQLPDGFRRPQTDAALETFIRGKYEHKKYMAREWVPPPPAVANWDREIDDEMEQLKRAKKKSASATAVLSPKCGPAAGAAAAAGVGAIALPKPTTASPKSARPVKLASASAPAVASSASADLLGLTVGESSQSASAAAAHPPSADDLFSSFLSAPPANAPAAGAVANGNGTLAEQEADFFNQPAPTETERGKMTRDSILALYGQTPKAGPFGHQQPQPQATTFGQFAGNANFANFASVQQAPSAAPQIAAFAQFPSMQAASGGGGGGVAATFGALGTPSPSNGSAALNQKMNTLNLGNVWD